MTAQGRAAARRTKIVATIGPASDDPETLARLVEAGLDVARLNFAHGTRESQAATAVRVREAAGRAGRQVAILQDLPGPKLRIGPLRDDVAELHAGELLTLVCGETIEGDATRMSVAWRGLCGAVEPGDEIFLADGSVRLCVERVREPEGEVDARIDLGGVVASRQGVNVPGELMALPSVPEGDLELLRFGESIGVDMVALSFVRRAEDVEEVREHTELPLIAKIEKPQAVRSAEEIIMAADCVMVARGDLGIELELQQVPLVQKRVIALAGEHARPVITATQMLESMVTSSRPTRAEVTDVANAILDGTDALMLSQETAVGAYPVDAVRMMASIAERTEPAAPTVEWNEHRVRRDQRDPAYTVAYNACAAARQLGLSAILCPTLSGRSARLISAHRPEVPVYAVSPSEEVVRRCSLMWGVEAASMPTCETTEELIAAAVARALEIGWIVSGERVAITAGLPSNAPGTTSLLQVQDV
ncbi:MAG: pyruvate kinase [Actinomycetota bacterium]|nr:pyruvate kinase [Actinomycetota bacterium]